MTDPKVEDAPFQVVYKTAKPGETQLPPVWSVPFDTEFRPVEIPNVVPEALVAYASLGHHVTRYQMTYCPSYSIAQTLNMRMPGAQAMLVELQKSELGGFPIVDRRSNTVYWLHAAASTFEAAVSWFTREHGHERCVLCHDRKDGAWYVEAWKDELTLALSADGTEVAVGEQAEIVQYNTPMHSNAVVAYGE